MKKILYAFILVGFALSSCHKSGVKPTTSNSYFMKFKVNGTQHSMSIATANTLAGSNGYFVTTIYGIIDATGKEQMVIQLYTKEALKANTKFTSDPNAVDDVTAAAHANNNVGTDSSSDGDSFSLSLNSVGATSLGGTFSGVLSDEDGNIENITEGSFNAVTKSN